MAEIIPTPGWMGTMMFICLFILSLCIPPTEKELAREATKRFDRNDNFIIRLALVAVVSALFGLVYKFMATAIMCIGSH